MTFKDAFYDTYSTTHLQHRKPEATLSSFRAKATTWDRTLGRFLPPDRTARIIDVGCGSGKLVWWLQSIGYASAEGIDASDELVAIAQSLGIPNVSVASVEEHLREKPHGYDVIILRDVLEHFSRSQVVDILVLCRDALRHGGRVIIQVPNADSPTFGHVRYGDFTHELAFTVVSLAQVFNRIGFTEAQYHAAPPLLIGRRAVGRRALWTAVEKFYQLLLYAELGPGNRIVTQNILAVATRPMADAPRPSPKSA